MIKTQKLMVEQSLKSSEQLWMCPSWKASTVHFTALKATNPSINDKENNLTLEVAQHLGMSFGQLLWTAPKDWCV